MAIARPLVHIGYRKTGTTFLQKNLFNCPEQGFLSPWTVSGGEAVEHFLLTPPWQFEPQRTRDEFFSAISPITDGSHVPTLSHEDLAGIVTLPNWNCFMVAERLKATFPEARIFIMVREQQSMIRSCYSHYIRDGGRFSLRHFLGIRSPSRSGFAPILPLNRLEYHALVETYVSHFGMDSVLVLPFELLRSNPQDLQRRLFTFLNHSGNPVGASASENKSCGAATTEVRRLLNTLPGDLPPIWSEYGDTPFLWRAKNRLCRYADAILPRRLQTSVARHAQQLISVHVGTHFAASNSLLQRYVPISLEQFGYSLAGPEASSSLT